VLEQNLELKLSAPAVAELEPLRDQFNQWLSSLHHQQNTSMAQNEQFRKLIQAVSHIATDEQKHLCHQEQTAGQTLTMIESMNQSVLDEVQSANLAADAASQSNQIAKQGQQTVASTVQNIEQLAVHLHQASATIAQLQSGWRCA
jgi:methyl-accepting chemotaxis protein